MYGARAPPGILDRPIGKGRAEVRQLLQLVPNPPAQHVFEQTSHTRHTSSMQCMFLACTVAPWHAHSLLATLCALSARMSSDGVRISRGAQRCVAWPHPLPAPRVAMMLSSAPMSGILLHLTRGVCVCALNVVVLRRSQSTLATQRCLPRMRTAGIFYFNSLPSSWCVCV